MLLYKQNAEADENQKCKVEPTVPFRYLCAAEACSPAEIADHNMEGRTQIRRRIHSVQEAHPVIEESGFGNLGALHGSGIDKKAYGADQTGDREGSAKTVCLLFAVRKDPDDTDHPPDIRQEIDRNPFRNKRDLRIERRREIMHLHMSERNARSVEGDQIDDQKVDEG